MDALTIRRYRGLTTPQFPAAGRTEKPSAAAPAQKALFSNRSSTVPFCKNFG